MRRCDWAGCPRSSTKHDQGWDFCARHFAEHEALVDEEQRAELGEDPTIREQVVTLHAAGLTDRQMATRIGCDRSTVRWHRDALDLPRNQPGQTLQPCGSHAAFVRHKNHGEQPCDACVVGERKYQAEKARERRKRAA